MRLAVCKIAGKGDDDKELRYLGRLYLLTGKSEPASRPERGITDEDYGHEHKHGQRIETHRHLTEHAVVQPGNSKHDAQPEYGKHQLLGEGVG